MIEELLAWKAESPYASDGHYIFAWPKKKGKPPYWMGKLMQVGIKPVAESLKLPLKGWHTLRQLHNLAAAKRE